MRLLGLSIIRWEWPLLLFLLLPIVIIPSPIRGLALLLIPLLWVVRWLVTGHFLVATPYDLPLLLLLIMALISLLIGDINLSFRRTAGLTLSIALLYGTVAYSHQHKHSLWHILIIFLLAGTGMNLIGVIGVDWPPPFTLLNTIQRVLPDVIVNNIPRPPGGGNINQNEIAGVAVWFVPMFIAGIIWLRRMAWQQHKLLYLLLVGAGTFNLIVLLATVSRGGLLALAAAILVMIAIPYRWGRWSLLVGTLIVISLLIFSDTNILFPTEESRSAVAGLDERLELWSRAIFVISDFPLTGTGINRFHILVPEMYPLYLTPPETDVGHAHNHFLQAGVDVGLPGLIAYLALWAISTLLLWQSWHRTTQQTEQAILLGLSGGMMGGWIFGLFDDIPLGARPSFMWWLLLAMIVVVHKQTTAASPEPE